MVRYVINMLHEAIKELHIVLNVFIFTSTNFPMIECTIRVYLVLESLLNFYPTLQFNTIQYCTSKTFIHETNDSTKFNPNLSFILKYMYMNE